MLADTTLTVTRFLYAGRFSVGMLIAAGIVLAVLVAAMVWYETRSARRWMLVPLLALRLTVVGLVLWMLAERTMQTEVQRTHPKAMCLMVDGSASMGVSDEAADGQVDADGVRWAAFDIPTGISGGLANLDGAAAGLGASANELGRIGESARGGPQQREQIGQLADHIEQLVKSAVERLNAFAPVPGADEAVRATELAAIRGALVPTVVDGVADLKRQVGRRTSASDGALAGQIGQLRQTLLEQADRVRQLADGLAGWYAGHAEPAAMDRLRDKSKWTRQQKVATWLRAAQQGWLSKIEQQAKVLRYRFDGEVSGVSPADLARADGSDRGGSAQSTDLTKAVQQAARDAAGESLEAVFLLTDGRHNADSDPLKVAAATSGAPIYVVPIGNTQPLRDVVLHHAQAPRMVIKNDSIVFETMLDAHGYNGEELSVDLVRDDQVLETRQVKVTSDAFVTRMSFAHKAEQLGTQQFRLRARLMPGEKVRDNNEADLVVEVAEDKVRTLLVDRLPRWEFRFLRNLFKRDEHMEYKDILLEGEEGGGGRPTLPNGVDEWARFRVVILGDVGPKDLNADRLNALEQFVQVRGGTLILIAGDEMMPAAFAGTPLERMLPVEESRTPQVGPDGFGLFVTAEGRAIPAIRLEEDPLTDERLWREQVTLQKISDYCKPKPTAHVLIGCVPKSQVESTSRDMPAFLCWQQFGRGRVVYLSAPATYRLRQWFGDRYHHRFWGQLLRWSLARELAAGSKTCRLATDKTGYQQGEEVQASLRLSDLAGQPVQGAKVTLAARQDDREIARGDMSADAQEPGVYKAVIKGLPAGEVTLVAAGQQVQVLLAAEGVSQPVETRIRVEPDVSSELRNTRCNLPLVKQIADATGGLLLPPTALEAAATQLDLKPKVTRTVSDQPQWVQWKYLWVFIGCLAAEWVLRKAAGLA